MKDLGINRETQGLKRVLFVGIWIMFGWHSLAQDRQALLKKAAAGDPQAQFELGQAYVNGRGNKQDCGQGLAWLGKAAEQGLLPAITALAEVYYTNPCGQCNYEQARHWFEIAAGRDDRQAIGRLGYLLADRVGYQSAMEWFLKGAALADGYCTHMCGYVYYYGKDLSVDLGKAHDYFSKGAELGYADSFRMLGIMLANGQGVEKNEAAAVTHFEIAAGKDADCGAYELAYALANSKGVQQNYQAARKWYQKAAALNNSWAMNNLGTMYANAGASNRMRIRHSPGTGKPRNSAMPGPSSISGMPTTGDAGSKRTSPKQRIGSKPAPGRIIWGHCNS